MQGSWGGRRVGEDVVDYGALKGSKGGGARVRRRMCALNSFVLLRKLRDAEERTTRMLIAVWCSCWCVRGLSRRLSVCRLCPLVCCVIRSRMCYVTQKFCLLRIVRHSGLK